MLHAEGAPEANRSSWRERTLWVLGQRVTVLAASGQTGGVFALIDIESPPGVPGPPPHYHEDCSETFHVLEGALELTRGDETLVLGVGESAIVPRGVVHTFRNPGGTGARVLSVFSPAGFERFFEDFGTASEGEMSLSGPPVEPEVIERVLSTSREYGMVIPGAPG